jgi:hypothetical protein
MLEHLNFLQEAELEALRAKELARHALDNAKADHNRLRQ